MSIPSLAVNLPIPLVPAGSGLLGLRATTKLVSVAAAAVLAAYIEIAVPLNCCIFVRVDNVHVPDWLTANALLSLAIVTRSEPVPVTPLPTSKSLLLTFNRLTKVVVPPAAILCYLHAKSAK